MSAETIPYAKGSETSKAAAKAIKPKVYTLRAEVLDFIVSCGAIGATDEQIQLALDLNGSTQRPRRRDLVLKGIVRDSGTKRPTRSGRYATVWVATAT